VPIRTGQAVRLDGEAVRNLRRHLGVSQRELGRRCRLSHAAISRVERDALRLAPVSAARLATALGVPTSGLAVNTASAREIPHLDLDRSEVRAVRGSLVETLAKVDRALGIETKVDGPGVIHVTIEVADRPSLVHDFAALVAAEGFSIKELRAARLHGVGEIACLLDEVRARWSDRLDAALQQFLAREGGTLKCFVYAQRDHVTAAPAGHAVGLHNTRVMIHPRPRRRSSPSAAWPSGQPRPARGNSAFIVSAAMTASDRIGLVRDVTGALASHGVSLSAVEASEGSRGAPGTFEIWFETDPMSRSRAALLERDLVAHRLHASVRFQQVHEVLAELRDLTEVAS
jgi:transcriptional regulator with XRE-family HTH domain/predicted amino acid-binding ACT domain protein